MDLVVSCRTQRMNRPYINKSLKGAYQLKRGGKPFFTWIPSIFTLFFTDLGSTLCITDREPLSAAVLPIRTHLLASQGTKAALKCV